MSGSKTMQIKKRARSVKFGKKDEPVEEKKEVEQSHQQLEPVKQEVKQEVMVKEENKEANVVPEVVDNRAESTVVEKNSDQVNQEVVQVKEEMQAAPAQAQSQEIVNESPAGAVTEKEPVADEGAYIVQTEVKKNMLRYFILIAVISFFVGLVSMAGISMFFQKTPFALPFIARKAAEVTPSPVPTIAVEPTKVKEVNLAEYSIEVLNGSGITGGAAKLKTALTTEGFQVTSTGNADKSDYTDTIISAKKEVNSAYLEKLKDNLKKTYTLASDSKIPVPESSEADIIITIGSNVASNSAQK